MAFGSIISDMVITRARLSDAHPGFRRVCDCQGFARPITDLSRSASVEDIVGTTAIVLAQA